MISPPTFCCQHPWGSSWALSQCGQSGETDWPASVDELHGLNSQNRGNYVISVVASVGHLHQPFLAPTHKHQATLSKMKTKQIMSRSFLKINSWGAGCWQMVRSPYFTTKACLMHLHSKNKTMTFPLPACICHSILDIHKKKKTTVQPQLWLNQ